jgi:HNH endonuclease
MKCGCPIAAELPYRLRKSGSIDHHQFQAMLTAAQVRELLSYNPRTGVFHWKVSAGRAKCGKAAGGRDRRGVHRVRIDGQLYQASRLAWLYVTGRWPKHEITCINGDRSDIRRVNLQETTHSQRRAFAPARSKLGVKGVWITKHGKSKKISRMFRHARGSQHRIRQSGQRRIRALR